MKNGIYAWYELGNVKKKTQDYFTGEVHQYGRKIKDIKGNYMGYMDIGNTRFIDVREVNKYYFPIVPNGSAALESDASKRLDSVTLRYKTSEEAQRCKETLEEVQRNDRKLREEAEARRAKGGKKYKNFY